MVAAALDFVGDVVIHPLVGHRSGSLGVFEDENVLEAAALD